MSLVLDAGAFVAIERGDRQVVALIKRDRLSDREPRTHGGVLGQIWRGGGGRQTNLARILAGVDVEPLDEELGLKVGLLLGRAQTSDVVDAAVVLIATDGDEILTSDSDDLAVLARAAGLHVDLIEV